MAKPSKAQLTEWRRVQGRAARLLTADDQDYLHVVINEYWAYRDVDRLVLCLLSALDTPAKLDLVEDIRDLIDEQDVPRFDKIAPFGKMAHPAGMQSLQRPYSWQGTESGVDSVHGGGRSIPSTNGTGAEARNTTPLRTVTLVRVDESTPLGLSICGGWEHRMGIFVSTVDPGSLAERSGLGVGDRLLDVNGMNFERIAHSTAVKVLRSPGRIVLLVKPAKRPGNRLTQLRMDETGRRPRAFTDPVAVDGGSPTSHSPTLQHNPARTSGASSDLDEAASQHALSELRMGGGSIDVRKINIAVEPGFPLGIAIRGGREHNIGIFVSSVHENSIAAKNGLQVGDQVLDVNGTSFMDISHQDAILVLKSSPYLVMTVKAMGKIPLSGRNTGGQLVWLEPATILSQEETDSAATKPPEKSRNSPKTPERARKGLFGSSPKKEVQNRRQLEKEKAALREQEPTDFTTDLTRGRQRSMTLPSRRSQSLSSSDPGDATSLPRGRRSRSRNRQQDATENGQSASPGTQPRGIGGLSSARQAGSRIVSSLRRKTSAGQDEIESHTSTGKATIPNNQQPNASPSMREKMSRQDGDGSDASEQPADKKSTHLEPPKVAGDASPFFSRGLGSQVMLTASATQASSHAYSVLDRAAKNVMTDAEHTALMLHIKRYGEDQNPADLVTALLPLLNTSEKVDLLRDIRSLISPQHIQQFDSLVAKREVQAMKERNQQRPAVAPGAEATSTSPPTSPQRFQLLSAIQSGRPALRKVVSSPADSFSRHKSDGPPPIFSSSAALRMLERGMSLNENEEPVMRRKESFVAWNDSHEGVRKRGLKKSHSFAEEILVELSKTKPKLGLSIEGGVDTKQPEVRISEVLEGGVAFDDGFLQPGFEIVSVDNQSIRGCTHTEAVQRISSAFSSQREIMEMLVVPEY